MFLANRLLQPLALLIIAMASAAGAAEAVPVPKAMPGPSPETGSGDPMTPETVLPGSRSSTLTLPKAEPAFCSLFVVVMPWNADRYFIQAGRKVQFALRLDEPKEPAFRVTLRF